KHGIEEPGFGRLVTAASGSADIGEICRLMGIEPELAGRGIREPYRECTRRGQLEPAMKHLIRGLSQLPPDFPQTSRLVRWIVEAQARQAGKAYFRYKRARRGAHRAFPAFGRGQAPRSRIAGAMRYASP